MRRAGLRRAAVLALAAFAARGAYILGTGGRPGALTTPDSSDYLAAARNLRENAVFSLSERPPLVPDTLRTPGYPVFLLPFAGTASGGLAAAAWAQAALGGAAVGLVYAAGLLLWRRERAALAASLAFALDPASIFHAGLILTETLFTTLAALALYALARAWESPPRSARWWAAAGMACGAAALVRPVGLYLFVFAAGASAWALLRARRPAGRPVLALALSALLLPGLWVLRNRASAGVWTFSSIQGLNFFGMRAAAVEMELTGEGFEEAMGAIEARLAAQDPGASSSREELSRRRGRWAARFLLAHPLAYLRVMAKDAAKLLGGHAMEIPAWTLLGDEAFDPKVPRGPPERRRLLGGTGELVERHPLMAVPVAVYWVFLAAVYFLALRGARLAWAAGERAQTALVLSAPAYLLLVCAGALAYYRFRLPMMPAIFLLAGRGLEGPRRASAR